jgi:hypothetical protein
MEEKKPRIAIVGSGADAEAKVALLKEKFGDDVILVDANTVVDFGHRPHPFDPEPMVLVNPYKDVYDYDMIRDINNEYSKVPRSDRRGTVANVRNSKEDPKIQRNAPCPCNSGKKYKNCCFKA